MRRVVPPLLLENVPFRRFWLGETISLLGDQITLLAVPLAAVYLLAVGPEQMGYLTAAALVPDLLFSLHAGVFVDRRGRRRQTMIAADLGRAAALASVPATYAAGALTLWQLYGVVFVAGTLTVLFGVSYSGLFAALVPRERTIDASSLLHGSRALSYVLGPSLAGLLVKLASAPFALLLDALSYVGSAGLLATISPPEPATEEAERGHLLTGLRFIRRTPVLLAALASTATINFFNFAFWALFVLFATRTLGIGPGTLGLVLGAGAVGGLVGSVATRRLARRIGVGGAFVAGSFLFPAPLLLVPLARGPEPVVLACLFLAEFGSGLGVMILDISIGSIFVAIVPDRLRARFSGAYNVVNKGVRPLGSLAGGALGAAIGVRETLWLAAVGALLGGLFLLPSPLPRLRSLPEAAEFQ
jgi:MFS family permease